MSLLESKLEELITEIKGLRTDINKVFTEGFNPNHNNINNERKIPEHPNSISEAQTSAPQQTLFGMPIPAAGSDTLPLNQQAEVADRAMQILS